MYNLLLIVLPPALAAEQSTLHVWFQLPKDEVSIPNRPKLKSQRCGYGSFQTRQRALQMSLQEASAPPYRCRMTSFWRTAASMTQPWTSRQVFQLLFRNEDNSDLETPSIKKKAQCISVDNESSYIEIRKDEFFSLMLWNCLKNFFFNNWIYFSGMQ